MTMKPRRIIIKTPKGTYVLDPADGRPLQDSNTFHLLHLQALELSQVGKLREGLEIVQHLVRLCPNDPYVLHTLGMILTDMDLSDQALPVLRRVVRLLPDVAAPLVSLGAALLRKGEAVEAEAMLERALAMESTSPFALTNLAACLLALKKSPHRAELLLRNADKLMPNNQSVWLNLGKALREQGKLAEADQALLRAIQIDPNTEMARTIEAARRANGHQTPRVDPSRN